MIKNTRIEISKEECIGCGVCVRECPVNKTLDPWTLSGKEPIGRIFKVVNGTVDPLGFCLQCIRAPCIEACPAGAIHRNQQGIVVIDEWECNCCGICLRACPYNAIFIDPRRQKWTAVKCDLCMRDPICVKSCPTNALKIVGLDVEG